MKRWKLKKWKVKGRKCEGLPTQLAGKKKTFSFCVFESFVVVSSDIRDYFTSAFFLWLHNHNKLLITPPEKHKGM